MKDNKQLLSKYHDDNYSNKQLHPDELAAYAERAVEHVERERRVGGTRRRKGIFRFACAALAVVMLLVVIRPDIARAIIAQLGFTSWAITAPTDYPSSFWLSDGELEYVN